MIPGHANMQGGHILIWVGWEGYYDWSGQEGSRHGANLMRYSEKISQVSEVLCMWVCAHAMLLHIWDDPVQCPGCIGCNVKQ